MSFRIPTPAPGAHQLSAALDRAGEVEPALAHRARTALDEVLAPTAVSALGTAAWGCSALTPTGYPVELTVSSARNELRWVAEVQAPEADPASAPARALAACGPDLTPDQVETATGLLEQRRRGSGLRFGAWIAGRHSVRHDVRKLYLELVPGDTMPGAELLAGLAEPRFIGLTADGSGTVELYARVRPRVLYPLEQLVQRSGLPLPGDVLSGRLAAWGHGRAVPSHALSVSISLIGDRVAGVAAFTYLHRIASDDDAVRRQVLAAATAGGWPSQDLYERISRPLDGVRDARMHHGPLSLVVRADGAEETHVGLAPPPVPASSPHHRELESCHA